MRWVAFVVLGFLFSAGAKAQVVPTAGDSTYLAVSSTINPGGVCGATYCVTPRMASPELLCDVNLYLRFER
jgi:hypothetical protein